MTDAVTLTPDQVADRLGVKRQWLMRRVQRKEVPHLRMGLYVKFTEGHVEQIIAKYAVEPRVVNPLAPTERSTNSRRRSA